MSQSPAKIVLHIVYSTKNREPVLTKNVRSDLYGYTIGVLDSIDCVTLAINGTEDHVHALVLMSRTISPAKMVEDMKRGYSRWLKERNEISKHFAWQGGYGAFSVSESQVSKVIEYVNGQEEHHRLISFQDELRLMLKKHRIEFDERYLWS